MATATAVNIEDLQIGETYRDTYFEMPDTVAEPGRETFTVANIETRYGIDGQYAEPKGPKSRPTYRVTTTTGLQFFITVGFSRFVVV